MVTGGNGDSVDGDSGRRQYGAAVSGGRVARRAAIRCRRHRRIEAPLIGENIMVGQPAMTIGRGSNAAAIQSPVSGTISDINLSVRENPMLAYEDPYASGWVLKVHTSNLRQDLRKLLIGKEYVHHLGQEIERLIREMEMVLDKSALPDLVNQTDIAGQLPDIGWERLVRLFLNG